MTSKQKLALFLVYMLVFLCCSCKQAKYVPEGKYLYQVKKKNVFRSSEKSSIHFLIPKDSSAEAAASHNQIVIEDLYDLVKPQPNRKLNLFVYNKIDTLKMQNQIERKTEKTLRKNNKKIAKQNTINKKRNEKAKIRGSSHFYEKNIKLKSARKGWRFWVSKNIGEQPSIMDSLKVAKSATQMHLYLKKRGFYENKIKHSIVYKENRRKAYPIYEVTAGEPIRISSLTFDLGDKGGGMAEEYKSFLKRKDQLIFSGDLLDEDKLDLERERFSKYCRDNAYFNFSKNYIYFEVDTMNKDHLADIKIQVIPKTLDLADGSTKTIKHTTFKVSDVTYYVRNKNRNSFTDFAAYQKRLSALGMDSTINSKFPLLDTLYYVDKVAKKKYLLFGPADTLVYRGVFIYNEKLPVSPFLLDRQNFLEITDGGDNGWYKEYYVERSYSRLLGLDIFGNITPDVKLNENKSRMLSVSYYLMTSSKQLFSIEPNVSNSNGFLGLAASVNYTNKNIFGGAEKLKISITGGAESQPAVFDRTIDGDLIKTDRQFNTIEIFPKISLEFPRLLPFSKRLQKTLSKRLFPITVIDLSYNFQKRTDFTRNLTEFGYSWRFNEGKSKIHKIKWQSFNFVKLDKSDEFQILLSQLNDPFLLNTYNDHFSNKFEYVFQYNNQRVQNEIGKKNYLFGTATVSTSGYVFDKIGVGENDIDTAGLRQVFGVPFTQFLHADFDLRYYMNLVKSRPNNHVIAYRLLAGAGYAYGNSLSLPYEESFFAGGSNDIRAFTARTMAPGGTRTWLDVNAANTQVADMRLELNVEYRFQFSDLWKAAIFADAGNIWKLSGDEEDLGVFRLSTAPDQIALGAGVGLRLDFDFFVVRLDVALPIHNPYMFEGERWIWNDHQQYRDELENLPTNYVESLKGPFNPNFNFGIGYPF